MAIAIQVEFKTETKLFIVDDINTVFDKLKNKTDKPLSIKVIEGEVEILLSDSGSLQKPEHVINYMCEKLKVSVEMVKGKSKIRRAYNARAVVAYVLRTKLNLTFKDIGQLLEKDHTSIIHYVNAVNHQITNGEGYLFELIKKSELGLILE